MNQSQAKRRSEKRKCCYCRRLYVPDHRNRHHQKACSKAECRAARKRTAQAQWLARPENRNHFRGHENVHRVQEWRKIHPNYWRKTKRPKASSALQDVLNSQPAQNQRLKPGIPADKPGIPADALQDVLSTQHPLVVGLISNLYDHALQDDIAQTIRALIDKGRMILGSEPG